MQCNKCRGRSDVYLCRKCIRQLDDDLDQMPWLAERLREAYAKQNALAMPPQPPRPKPADPDLEEAPMPYDTNAGEVYDEVRTVLMRWCRDLCDTLHIEWMPINAVPSDFIGPLRPTVPANNLERIPASPGEWRYRTGYIPTIEDLAAWLRAHHLDIARDESADLCAGEIEDVTRKAYQRLNPRKRVYCGPCPTVVGKDGRDRPITCEQGLWADWDDDSDCSETHVVCWKCRQTHRVDDLKRAIFAHADHFLMTTTELLSVLDNLGEHLAQSTLYRWVKEGRVRPRGYRRDEQITPHRQRRGDPAVFSLAQVRGLMAQDEAEKKKPKEKVG